jgi:hypothetical protein
MPRYTLRTLLILLAVGLTMVGSSCRREITRDVSSLIDDLSGVWTHAVEAGSIDGSEPATSVIVVRGRNYTIYDYRRGRYSTYRRGEVIGQEGVYFLQNEASYYSPQFFVENDGHKILISTKGDYDRFISTGKIDVSTLIRSADQLDFGRPPPRPSIETVGLPYYDDYPELRKQNVE